MRDNYNGHKGREIREPKLTQNTYLHLNKLSNLLKKSIKKNLRNNAIVLDLGCGKKPYQPFFIGKSIQYMGIDISHSGLVDVLCSGEKLSFRDNSFSECICTQLLEHVENPRAVVNEIFRVLKPSGIIFLSTHGIWPVHGAPNDYWRWTEYGLTKLLNNFDIHEVHKDGPILSLIQLLELYIPMRSLGIMIIFLLNKLGNLLDNVAWLNAKLPRLSINYIIVARKHKSSRI